MMVLRSNNEKEYLHLFGDRTLRLMSQSTVFNDMQGGATAAKQGALNKPDFDFTELCHGFDDSADETLSLVYQTQHGVKLGANAFPHVHWKQSQAEAINWAVAYRWLTNGAAWNPTWTNIVFDQHAFTYVSGDLTQISYVAGGIPAPASLSAILQLKLTRDVSEDTVVGDVLVAFTDVHVEIDGMGSEQEYIKTSY